MSANINTPAMENIHIELTPILTELYTLGWGNNEHPSVKKLYNWFVDQQRTGEEFQYVLGPLRQHLLKNRKAHSRKNIKQVNYLDNVAVEALAVKCPILKGFWEQAAWSILTTDKTTVLDNYTGDHDKRWYIMEWIIQMIGNAEYCPNPYLRLEFITLLLNITIINQHNWSQAFESVFFACSFIDIDYLLEPVNGCYDRPMDFYNIIETLETFAEQGYLSKFDDKLAKELTLVKSIRLTAIVHDVSYNFAVNPRRYAQPVALHGLTALLVSTSGLIQLYSKKWRGLSLVPRNQRDGRSWMSLFSHVNETTHLLKVLICNFNNSCQTPQLLDLTTACIMAALELVIPMYADSPISLNPNCEGYMYYKWSFCDIDELLETVFGEKGVFRGVNSPVGKEITLRYDNNLSFLRGFQNIYHNFVGFSNIMVLIIE